VLVLVVVADVVSAKIVIHVFIAMCKVYNEITAILT